MDFALSKLFWTLAAPGNVLALILLVGGFMTMSRYNARQDFGRHLCVFAALAFFAIAVLPIGDWLLQPLENRFPPAKLDRVDGIVIIGGDENPRLSDERGRPVAFVSALRYVTLATLARQYPDAQLVFSGGSGSVAPYGKMKDADVAREALAGIGVSVARMTFETKSRNTYENAINAADLVHPSPKQKWLLVTSAWHMPRALACFRKAGWNIYPAPSDYVSGTESFPPIHFNLAENLMKVTAATHEYFGLLEYWMAGYIDKPWPG